MVKKRGKHRQITASVNKYIKENFSKGHSLESIKKWLIMHGFDENFVCKTIKKFQAKQFAKKLSLSSFIVAVTLLFVSLPVFNTNITGAVTASSTSCCIDNSGICHAYTKNFCVSENLMYIKHNCLDLPYCWNSTLP